jgi:hypothetical protein
LSGCCKRAQRYARSRWCGGGEPGGAGGSGEVVRRIVRHEVAEVHLTAGGSGGWVSHGCAGAWRGWIAVGGRSEAARSNRGVGRLGFWPTAGTARAQNGGWSWARAGRPAAGAKWIRVWKGFCAAWPGRGNGPSLLVSPLKKHHTAGPKRPFF